MYKRKGCELWTIEDKDFEDYLDWSSLNVSGRKRISLKNLSFSSKVNLLDEFDIILEIDGKRYLGYLGSHRDLIRDKQNNRTTLREVEFYICQENYLKGIKIEKEVEL